MALVAATTMHVQVSTRFLQHVARHVELGLVVASEVRTGRGAFSPRRGYLSFALVGAALFANLYPWT